MPDNVNPFIQALRGIARALEGKRDAAKQQPGPGPWEAMIQHEAGPNRLQPLHGFKPFDPALRRKGG